MNDLKNKRALITGGSRGLGKAIAIELAKSGVDIAITGRNEERLESAAAEIEALGVKVSYAAFDVSNYSEVQDGIGKLLSSFGSIDILVNNAGVAAFGSVLEMPVEEWTKIVQVNLMGLYYVTKEVLPQMVELEEGDIINISSTAGLNGNATTSAYSASKFGVIGFSESLMKEVRKNNIRVSAYTPSTFESDMSIDIGITEKGSQDRVLQPSDLAELIIATLKLPRRALLKNVAMWSTNP